MSIGRGGCRGGIIIKEKSRIYFLGGGTFYFCFWYKGSWREGVFLVGFRKRG
jgi:hypothetical protein